MRSCLGVAATLLCLAACGGENAMPDDSAAVDDAVTQRDVEAPADSAADTSDHGPAPIVRPPTPSLPIAGSDTAVGTVRLLGTAQDARVVVQTPAGPIAAAGDLAPAIARLDGMEVWIQGPLSVAVGRAIPPRQITVRTFEVRSVGGVPVLDGTLRAEGEAMILEERGGAQHRLTTYPAELRALAGRRAWITRTADGSVSSFGEIR